MKLKLNSSPFIHNSNQVNYLMIKLLITLLPAMIIWLYFFKWYAMLQLVICLISCYACEWLALKLRKKTIAPFLLDGSAAVTAILLAFVIPPIAPWWVAFLASGFAMLLGKHAYGGLGQNLFNPAMLGYAIALISFPMEFAIWPSTSMNPELMELFYSLNHSLQVVFFSSSLDYNVTGATPLAAIRNSPIFYLITEEISISNPWVLLNINFLIGGLLLLKWRVIRWQIPTAYLFGVTATLLTFFIFSNESSFDLVTFHLFFGSTMIGAFYIATDPVSSATSNSGKIVYAFLIGVLLIMIRRWGNFPDGLAFAVLIANLFVPTLDYYLKPKR